MSVENRPYPSDWSNAAWDLWRFADFRLLPQEDVNKLLLESGKVISREQMDSFRRLMRLHLLRNNTPVDFSIRLRVTLSMSRELYRKASWKALAENFWWAADLRVLPIDLSSELLSHARRIKKSPGV